MLTKNISRLAKKVNLEFNSAGVQYNDLGDKANSEVVN
jgi:hypothetical protein